MDRKSFLASFVFLPTALATSITLTWSVTGPNEAKSATKETSPAAQNVQGAIAAENRADRADHDRLVEQAVRTAPNFPPARWQAGQLRVGDEWFSIDEAVAKSSGDDLRQQYRKMRSVYGNDAEGQLALARWCQKHHLTDETRAHASQLLAARPNDPEVLKMLELTWHKGQLISATELAERTEQDEKAKQALKHWRPIVVAIRDKVESKSPGEHDQGLAELKAIVDPAAIEALIAVFKNKPNLLIEAINVIGQMPGQEATDALLQQAVLTKNDAVLVAACEQLKPRSMYGYVPKLMAALSTPLQAKFEVTRDAGGVHFQQTVQREVENATIGKAVDTQVDLLTPNPNLGNIIGTTYAETFLDSQSNAKAVAKFNRKLTEFNESIYRVLESTVGTMATRDPAAWWDWWHSRNVLSLDAKPAYVDSYYNPVEVKYEPTKPTDIPQYEVVENYQPEPPRPQPPPAPVTRAKGCFARGTQVWTASGPMPIENIQIGDRVLSQSALSGELTFKPVLDITLGHQDFFAIDAEGEQFVATAGHVFWVSGAGWRMLKELKPGDRLHTATGWSEIRSIKPVEAGETHNLVVADFGTYFVGDNRMLTHDITIPQMVTGGAPGEFAIR